MTKVKPTAMMPVSDTCCKIFSRLSSVAKDGLAMLKNKTRKSSVMKGAMLRNWVRRKSPSWNDRAGAAALALGASIYLRLFKRPPGGDPC